jgi:hypothetical protein
MSTEIVKDNADIVFPEFLHQEDRIHCFGNVKDVIDGNFTFIPIHDNDRARSESVECHSADSFDNLRIFERYIFVETFEIWSKVGVGGRVDDPGERI